MKKRILFIVIIAVLVAAAGVGIASYTLRDKPPQTLSAAELLSLGEKYLLEMDYEQAIVYFNKVIEIDPKCVEAYIGLSEAHVRLGQASESADALIIGFRETQDNRLIDKMENVYRYLLELGNQNLIEAFEKSIIESGIPALIERLAAIKRSLEVEPEEEPTPEPTPEPTQDISSSQTLTEIQYQQFQSLEKAIIDFDYERVYQIYTASDFIEMYNELSANSIFTENDDNNAYCYYYYRHDEFIVAIELRKDSGSYFAEIDSANILALTIWGKDGISYNAGPATLFSTGETKGISIWSAKYAVNGQINGPYKQIQYDPGQTVWGGGSIETGELLYGRRNGICFVQELMTDRSYHIEYNNGKYVYSDIVLVDNETCNYYVSPGEYSFSSVPNYENVITSFYFIHFPDEYSWK